MLLSSEVESLAAVSIACSFLLCKSTQNLRNPIKYVGKNHPYLQRGISLSVIKLIFFNRKLHIFSSKILEMTAYLCKFAVTEDALKVSFCMASVLLHSFHIKNIFLGISLSYFLN